MNAFKHLIAEF